MEDRFDPLHVLTSCFTISSLGGLAALLRSDKPLTKRALAAAILYSGVVGLIAGLLLYTQFAPGGNLFILIGSAGLTGVGGVTLVDFLLQVLAKGGISIQIKPKEDPPQEGGLK